MAFIDPPSNPFRGPLAVDPDVAFDQMELPSNVRAPKTPLPEMKEQDFSAEFARQDEYLRRQYISQGLRPPNVGRRIAGPREPGDEILNPIQSDEDYSKSVALTKTPAQRSFEAGFQRDNPVASVINELVNTPATVDDPNYNAWEDIKGTEFERYWSSFVTVRNPEAAAALKLRIQTEEKQKEMADSSWWGTLGGMAGGLLSPTMLIPGMAIGRMSSGGISVSASALKSAGLVGGAIAIDEMFLQGSQETRSAEESLLNIGAGAVLGSLLGAGVAKFYSRAETEQAFQAYRVINQELLGGSLSAAAVDRYTREELAVSGTTASFLARSLGFLNPNLRGHNAISPEARLVMQNLAESSLYTKINDQGGTAAPGGAAETDFKTQFNRYNGMGQQTLANGFREYTEAGGKMNFGDYNLELARAIREGGVSSVPEIAATATKLKNEIFDPVLRDADEVGLISKDVKVLGAEGYLTRQYLREKIIAKQGLEDSFENAVLPQAEAAITSAYAKSQERIGEAVRRLEEENKLLQMDAKSRQQELLDIESGIARAEFENPRGFEVLSEVNELQQKLATMARAQKRDMARAQKHGKAVPTKEMKQLKTQIKNMYEASPEAQSLRKIVDGFKRRRSLTNKGFSGAEAKFDEIAEDLVNIDESSTEGLKRLITAGRKFERELNKLGTEDELADKVAGLQDQFAQSGKAYDVNLDRLASIKEGMEKELEVAAEKAKVENKPLGEQWKDYKKTYDRINAQIAREEKSAVRHQDRLRRIAEKIDEAEAIDIPAIKVELERMNRELMEDVAEATFKKNQRMINLMEKQNDYRPEVVKAEIKKREGKRKGLEKTFYDRWKGGSLFPDREPGHPGFDFKASAKEYVDDLVKQLTHKDMSNTADDQLDYKIAARIGPMRERVLPFSDKSMEDFLENDLTKTIPYYTRTMTAQIALSKMSQKLGGDGSPTLKDVVVRVEDSYRAIQKAVAKAETLEEVEQLLGRKVMGRTARAVDTMKSIVGKDQPLARSKELANALLDKQSKEIAADIFDMRDMILGRYAATQQASKSGRVFKAGAALSYIKDSGGFAISALPDMVRPAMVHGLLPYMDGIQHAVRQSEPFLRQLKDAHLSGLGLERYTNGRMADLAEVTNPYRNGTQTEALLHNMSKFGTKWNGISHMQDALESVDQMLVQNKIITGLTERKDERTLAFLGLDERSGTAERVRKMLAAYSEDLDGIKIANTDRWTDLGAAQAYRNALFKDVTSTIVRPGLGDVPKYFKTPLGQMVFQYRSFALASNQRILLRGLQENGARFASGLMGMTMMGVISGTLKAWRNGEESWERYKKKAESPGFLIGEGLDQSGLFSVMFEVANSAEKVGRIAKAPFNPIKDPLDFMSGGTGDTDQRRTWGKGFAESLFGPAVSLPTDLVKAAGSAGKLISGGDLTKGEKRGMVRALPFSTFAGIKEMNQLLVGDSPYWR